MPITVPLHVNGRDASIQVDDPAMPLLYALRNDLGLHGPRFGCGLGQCGSCTVHVDGEAIRSCQTPLSSLKPGQKIVTLEGLGSRERPHPVQQAFIDEQAVQCGYCINGMIMQSAAFLAKTPHPTEDEIRTELANNLCRCGTHLRIVRAVQRAAQA
jgi:nicotinate dehydrogenase subunit A